MQKLFFLILLKFLTIHDFSNSFHLFIRLTFLCKLFLDANPNVKNICFLHLGHHEAEKSATVKKKQKVINLSPLGSPKVNEYLGSDCIIEHIKVNLEEVNDV